MDSMQPTIDSATTLIPLRFHKHEGPAPFAPSLPSSTIRDWEHSHAGSVIEFFDGDQLWADDTPSLSHYHALLKQVRDIVFFFLYV